MSTPIDLSAKKPKSALHTGKSTGKKSAKSSGSSPERVITQIQPPNTSQEAHQLEDVTFDWQEEVVRAIFFYSGDLVYKDSVTTVSICRDALECLGHSGIKVLEITHLRMTKIEELQYRSLFHTIVRRLFDDRYVNIPVLLQ